MKRAFGIVVMLALPAIVRAQAPEDAAFFEKRVKAALEEHCFECHSAESAESGLRLDSRAAMLAGGERGAAIVPGDAKNSLLVLAIQHADQLHMPPSGKIPQQRIDDLAAWIKAGAHWPGEESPPPSTAEVSDAPAPLTEEERAFWAFQPVVAQPLPAVRDAAWPETPIDRFILARLEAAGVPPAPPADARAWLRRVTFDLTGLPPSPEEIEAFLADDSPDAREKIVDRLLASPRYGERWGRHWLDVARYADSNGLDENLALANAWRYRDWVVRAFGADKPFDEFVQEQIAGDLMQSGDWRADLERLVATGFLSIGAKMLAEDDPVKMQMDIIDEQLDVIGQAFMGLTLGCARCHDHKFDPLRMDDYYALAGIFKSTKTMENFSVVARWQELPLGSPQERREHSQGRERIAAKEAEIKVLQSRLAEALPRSARSLAGYLLLAAHRQSLLDEEAKRPPAWGDAAVPILPPGGLLIEAESFARGNVERATSGYGEGIGVLVNRGETPNFVEYDFEIAEAGLYKLDVRFAAASTRPCVLVVNGQTIEEATAGDVTGGWNPHSQAWRTAAFVELPSGKSVLRFEQPQAFPHIDKLILAPAVDKRGQPLPPRLASAPDGRELPRPMVRRWVEYFERLPTAAKPVFAAWGALANEEPAALAKIAADDPHGQRLCEGGIPGSLGEMAERYQKLFQQADAPTKLEDPVLESFRQILYDPAGPCALPEKPEAWYGREDAARLAALRDELKAMTDALPKLPEAMAVSEGQVEDLRIHLRGSHVTLGRRVPRRFPQILSGDSPNDLPPDKSGRLELAKWLTRPDHPLTARVIANRVWLWHFGEGIVRSPDNFGRLGERPTHPELLEWLAGDLVRSGWSLKELHRRIVLSAAYGMSSQGRPQDEDTDPENRFIRRSNRRRLDAEAIRDALLFAGGSLDLAMGGTLLPTANRQYVTSTASVDPVIYDTRRRSLYVPVVRSALYDFLQAFDFGDPSVLQGRRESTVIAPQALFLMNSRIVHEQSAALAQRLLAIQNADANEQTGARVGLAYEIAFGRSPTEDELADARAFLAESPGSEADVWQSYCRALFAASEFIYID
jgi:hypothetical protein